LNNQSKAILIVDDESYTRELLEMLLKDEGYNTMTAADGLEAVDKIKNNTFDLVCLDIRMPKLNGFETLEQIRSFNKEIKVIMITGYGPNELIKKAEIEHSIVGCIYKPFDIDDFIMIIRNAIG
jgi:two-component system response regulator (stage 0 sporulation protein F)